jgi:hypothetical protein
MKKFVIFLWIIFGTTITITALNAGTPQYPSKKQLNPITEKKARQSKDVADQLETLKTQPVIVTINISPANPSIKLNETLQFKATGIYPDKSTKDITSMVSWNSSDPNVAIIGQKDGMAKGLKPGNTQITASLYNKTSKPQILKVSDFVSSVELTQYNNEKETIIVGETVPLALQIKWFSGYQQAPIPFEQYLHSTNDSVISFEILAGNLTVVKGIKEGFVEIYAECEGVKSTPIKLTVASNVPLPPSVSAFDVNDGYLFAIGNSEYDNDDYVWKIKPTDGKLDILNVFGGSGYGQNEFGPNEFYDIVVDGQLNIHVAHKNGITKISADGKYFMPYQTNLPHTAISLANYFYLYALNGFIEVFETDGVGKLIEKIVLKEPNDIRDMAFVPSVGLLYILDHSAIYKFDKNGTLLSSFPVINGAKLATDPIGNLYVSFLFSPNCIKKFSPSGDLLAKFDMQDQIFLTAFDVADDLKIYVMTSDKNNPLLIINQ